MKPNTSYVLQKIHITLTRNMLLNNNEDSTLVKYIHSGVSSVTSPLTRRETTFKSHFLVSKMVIIMTNLITIEPVAWVIVSHK